MSPEINETVQTLIVTYGLNILGAIVIFVIGRWVAGLATRFLKRVLQRANVEESLGCISKFGRMSF